MALLGRIIMSCIMIYMARMAVYGFVGPDNYELYHDLHGPDGCGAYCVSQGDVGVVPYWSGDEEGDVYEGDAALPRTGSDKPVDMLEHSGGPCDETGPVVDAPGDVLVVSSEGRDIDRGMYIGRYTNVSARPPVEVKGLL